MFDSVLKKDGCDEYVMYPCFIECMVSDKHEAPLSILEMMVWDF